MTRRLGNRVLVALFAVWSAVMMTEPFQTHICAMHDGALVVNGAGEQHTHQGSSSHEPENRSNSCHCIGSCAVQTPAVLVGAAMQQIDPGLGSSAEFAPIASVWRSRPPFLLPYSLAPPATLS